uniref:SSD domain-containing protein n=1 Tax=Trichobilharzia regenti TaxID=157069 RepID=A0AA85JMB9_TRIRE|nr:unnamed protein product [Trichobilharzia regenti]
MKSARQFSCDGLPAGCASKSYISSSGIKTVTDSSSSSSLNSKITDGSSENIFYGPAYCTTLHWWWRSKFQRLEDFIYTHHWKILSCVVVLGLFCFGLKAVTVETDFDKLWIEESDRLTSEWKYLTKVLQNIHVESLYGDSYYFSRDSKLSRMVFQSQREEMEEKGDMLSVPSMLSKSKSEIDSSLISREFMGSMETVLQTTISDVNSQSFSERINSNDIFTNKNSNSNNTTEDDNYANILTPQALLDHMEFLIKVRRLTITVGSSKWSFKDLCQRATLPFGVEMHHLQAYLDMIIPCIIITPLDCFWEGAKVLGPEEAMWVPWFDERTLLQWTNIDPVGLLQDLSKRYGNYSQTEIKNLINLFHEAGIDHGYLNRSCLDPSDPACPTSAPNYKGEPPDISKILSGGCSGFASKMLHWPEEIIVGGRVHSIDSLNISSSADTQQVSAVTNKNNTKDLYDAVRRSDPYKHEDWTLDDARHVLREWRRNLKRLVIEHNSGLQSHIEWKFFAFTNASLLDLLQEITLRLGPITLVGCILMVFLYGVVSLLGWRDPVRSQCWLAICGLMIIALSSIAGLGICAAFGIPFNVLTIQVLPFLLLGLGVDGIFVLTTCHECCIARRIVPSTSPSSSDSAIWSSTVSLSSWSSKSSAPPVHVLAVHGPTLIFGAISISSAFFSAAFIPVPLIRQFCLQAGILTLVQSISVFILFPALLQLDATRRSQKRLDVLCCLRQPDVETAITTNSHRSATTCHCESRHLRTLNHHSSNKNPPACCHRHHHHHYHHHHRHCRHCHCTNPKKLTTNRDISINLAETYISSKFPHPTIQVNVVNHLPGPKRSSSNSHFDSDVTEAVVKTIANPDVHTVQTTVTVTGNQDKKIYPSSSSVGAEKLTVPECENDCVAYKNDTPVSIQRNQQKNVNKSEPGVDSTKIFPSPLFVRFARHFALLITSHWVVQLCVCLLGCGLFSAAVLCATFRLRLGLDWSSLTPSDTVEYGFIKTAGKAFGLSNFHIIARGSDLPGSRPVSSQPVFQYTAPSTLSGTSARSRVSMATVGRGIDFPMQQRRLRWMYDCLTDISGVMLSGRDVWLNAMRNWLEEVQTAFDIDREKGYIMDSGHWNANASELGVLGLRLIVQTDRGPELSRINTGRIVHGGIIDPPAFYTLLRVWRSKDALNFSSLPCVIYPEPSIVHVGRLTGPGRPSDLHALPPAEPIEFVQTSFYAVGVSEMDSQLDLVQRVRHITETATVQGVPVFPTGVPFTFVEHYMFIVRETAVAFGIFCAVITVSALILFSSPVTALLLVGIGAVGGACSAILGLIVLNLALNPISACLLLLSGGLGARISANFLGLWPVSHLSLDSFSSRPTRKTCLCQSNLSYGGCPSHSTQFCARNERLKIDPKQIILSKSSSLVHEDRINLAKRRQLARAQIVCILSNHFTPAFHASVGLLLALSLLVAARVQFIADYFFRLIVIVSLICLFNAVCLLPTICYLIGPLYNRFIIGGRRVSSNSIPYKSSVKTDNFSAGDKRIHRYLKSASTRANVNNEDHQVNMMNDLQLSFSSSSSNMSPNLSSPSSSRSSSSFSQSDLNPTDESHQNAKSPGKTEPFCKDSAYSILRESTKDIVHHSLKYPSHHSIWMDSTPDHACSSDAAATAAAAAVVVAAAAAASVRSRPPSLSTISEEPSHSNSTVSLNHATPSNTGHGSTSSGSGSRISCNNMESTNMPSDPSSPKSVNSVKPDFSHQNLPLSLVSSVDFIRMSKLLNPNMSANEICESLYSSIISPISCNSRTPVKSYRASKSKELILNPEIACTLLAAVTATSRQAAAYKQAGEVGFEGPVENIPPPPYSSVINQPQSSIPDKCSANMPPKSHRQGESMQSNTLTNLPDNEIPMKSRISNYYSASRQNTQSPAPSNIYRSNSYSTSSSLSQVSKSDHQFKKKTIPTVFSSYSSPMYQSSPENSSSVSKTAHLPRAGSVSSTKTMKVNIQQPQQYRHCSPDTKNTPCTLGSSGGDDRNLSNSNSNKDNSNWIRRHQSSSHSFSSSTHPNSQMKK